jgi:hypothetical protein
MKALSPKLSKVIELWRRTEHDGERQAARAQAEKLCAAEGMTFQDAVRRAEVDRSGGAPANPFAGFDDFCEAKEPGYKARKRAEKEAKTRARLARVAELIKRHGSKEAVIAPCEREQLIIAAVSQWRKVSEPPFERWTHSVDGWGSYYEKPPPHIEAAIRGAYPLPAPISEAIAEYRYWRTREQELDDVLDGPCDTSLDLIAYRRKGICFDLALRHLPVKDFHDLLARTQFYREEEYDDGNVEDSNLADLERLVSELESAPGAPASNVQHGQIEQALRDDPSRSDRSIARDFCVSPTTIGKMRARLGLAAEERSVRRGGQVYTARVQRV